MDCYEYYDHDAADNNQCHANNLTGPPLERTRNTKHNMAGWIRVRVADLHRLSCDLSIGVTS
eukprot:945962-Prorocentrum_lima.AAC.1